MVVKKTSFIDKFLNLGFHIGHSIFDGKYNFRINNQFLIGSRNNYNVLNMNFTIFHLQRSVFFLKKTMSTFATALFYYSNLDLDSTTYMFLKLFMKNRMLLKTRWSFTYLKWVPGTITNYNFCFLRFVKFIMRKIKISKSTRDSNPYSKTRFLRKLSSHKIFMTLFLKIFFIMEERLYLDDTLDILVEFRKFSYLFRVILFLRFWKSFFCIPEVLCAANPVNINSPLKEFSSLKLPVISLCDSNSSLSDISYPVLLNDDSVVSVLFMVSLFVNIAKQSHLEHYLI